MSRLGWAITIVVIVGVVVAFRQLTKFEPNVPNASASIAPSAPVSTAYEIPVDVYGDDHAPVDGARIVRFEQTIATTGTSGHATLTIAGAPGEVVELEVRCPEGYASPVKTSVALVAGMLQLGVTCKVLRDR